MWGQPAALAVAVTAPNSVHQPTGRLEITDAAGGTVVGSAPLVGGAAIMSLALGAGSHPLTVRYLPDAGFTAAAAAHTLVVTRAASTVSITTDGIGTPTSSSFGQPVAIEVRVGVAAPGAGAPAGTLTVNDGTTAIANVSLGGPAVTTEADGTRVVRLTVTPTVGSHSYIANYSGSADLSVGSATTTHLVAQLATTTVLTPSSAAPAWGQPVTFTVAVAAAGVTPSGRVVLEDDGVEIAAGSLDAAGVATFTVANLASLAVGAHSLRAVYAGTATHAGSEATTAVTVGQAPTAINLVATGGELGATLTATVTAPGVPTGTVPNGTVVFREAGAVAGTATLDANGVATVSIARPAGFYTVTATYQGTTQLAASTSSAVGVQAAPSTAAVVLRVTPTPVQYATPLTITVEVPTRGLPVTGDVWLTANGFTLGNGSLTPVNGVMSLRLADPTRWFAPGPVTVQAQFRGDANHAAATVSTVVQVGAGPTETVLTGVPGTAGVNVAVHAFARATQGGRLTGAVAFLVDGVEVARAGIAGDGSVTGYLPALPSGDHTVTAQVVGNPYWATSQDSRSVTVAAVSADLVVTSAGSAVVGRPATLSAFVQRRAGTAQPTGTLTFEGGGQSCTATVPPGGCTITFPAPGVVAMTASYSGDAFTAPAGPVPFTLNVVDATARLTATATPASPGAAGRTEWVAEEPLRVSWTVTGPTSGSVLATTSDGGSCSAPLSAGSCELAFRNDASGDRGGSITVSHSAEVAGRRPRPTCTAPCGGAAGCSPPPSTPRWSWTRRRTAPPAPATCRAPS